MISALQAHLLRAAGPARPADRGRPRRARRTCAPVLAHVGRLLGGRNLVDDTKRFGNIVTVAYVTGAIGSTHVGESFTYDYDLPNDTMCSETCASVAMSMFAQQMPTRPPRANTPMCWRRNCSMAPSPASRWRQAVLRQRTGNFSRRTGQPGSSPRALPPCRLVRLRMLATSPGSSLMDRASTPSATAGPC